MFKKTLTEELKKEKFRAVVSQFKRLAFSLSGHDGSFNLEELWAKYYLQYCL